MRRLTGALALAALLLTGCPAAQLDPQEAVAQAAERTSEAGTARLVMTVETVEQAGLDMTMSMEGTTDFDNGRAEMLMMLPGMPPELADGIRMIVDGTVVYTQMPMPGQPVQWVRLDAAEMMGAAGGGTPGGQNPADTLDFLRQTIEMLGTEMPVSVWVDDEGLLLDFQDLGLPTPTAPPA